MDRLWAGKGESRMTRIFGRRSRVNEGPVTEIGRTAGKIGF